MQGVGDIVARITNAAGLKKNKNCNCGSRQAKLNRLLPFKGSRHDPDWTVVMTTAPRADSTVIETINSVRRAGWEPVVFAEPDSVSMDAVEVKKNTKRLGVWHNWIQAARWACNRRSKYVLTLQDDVALHVDSKRFTESILWPSENCGFVSLYTPAHYQRHTEEPQEWHSGVQRVRTRSLWGACALVWPSPVLREVIEHPIAKKWLGVPPRRNKSSVMKQRKEQPYTIQNSDTAIGKIINRMRREMWFLDPSPVRHFARVSSIGHGGNSGRRNCGRCAVDNIPLAEQIQVGDIKPVKSISQ